MDYDIGLICHTCGTVTLFQSGARHPRRCARCHDAEARDTFPARDTRDTSSARVRRLQVDQLDWLE